MRFRADEMLDRAAGLTYYTIMSLFPALLVVIALLGLLGDESLVTKAVKYASDHGAPPAVADGLQASLNATIANTGGVAGLSLALGVAVALYGASGAFGAAGRAINDIHGVRDSRGFARHKLSDLGGTLAVVGLAVVALVSVLLGGGLADDVFASIGLGDAAAAVWRPARWGVAFGAALSGYAVVFALAPAHSARRRSACSPGALTGVMLWVLASAAFSLWVSAFGNYGATYGAFAGAVILLLWLYLSSIAFLFAAEVNAVSLRSSAGINNALVSESRSLP